MDGGDVLPHIPRILRNQATRDREYRDQAVRRGGDLGRTIGDEDENGEEELIIREQEERLGFSSTWAQTQTQTQTLAQALGNETNEADETDETRRVVLSPRPGGLVGNKHVARCLVCRADVEGWLRVYTG
jgi:hypothetical protein